MTVVDGVDLVFHQFPGRRTADPFAGREPGQSSARRVILEPVPTRTPHRHPHSEEVYFVAEGRGRVWIDGEQHPLQPGSWVRVPPGVPHATLPYERMTLVCFFPHPRLEDNIEELDTVLEVKEEPHG